MAISMEPRPGEGRFDLLLRWLTSKDMKKNQFAVNTLCGLGKPVVSALVMEAILPGKRAQLRIALLDVVQRIGGPLGPEDMFRLRDLLLHRNHAVRRKAEEVIMSMAPGGVPKTDAELAMARTLNPFLRPPLSRQDLRKALRADPDVARLRREFYAERRKEKERDQGRMS